MIRPFILYRTEDESGVSGTGQVAEGVVFSDGTAVLRWTASFVSTAVYDSLETLINIHGHDGKTEARFIDQLTCPGNCGTLAWTVLRFGRLTHKHSCKYRTQSYCQSHQVCIP